MFRLKLWFALALSLLPFASTPAEAAPGDRLRARIQQCQLRVDQADARCRAIVRDLANAGSAQAVQELNGQLKTWEKERSDAQFALYQAREQLRSVERQAAQLNADLAAFTRATRQFEADFRSWKGDLEAHNRDAAAHHQAVANFESLPPAQRTQAEADRLNRWRSEGNARISRLQTRQNELIARRNQLLQWWNSLQARVKQLEAS